MLRVPLTASVPDHAPEAVHAVAPVEVQVIVVLPPLATILGSALIATVGAVELVAELVVAVGLEAVEVLDAELVCVPLPMVFTLEPHADKPAPRANTSSKCQWRSRNCISESFRRPIDRVCICPTKTYCSPLQTSLIATIIYAIQGSAKCRVPDTSQFGDM